MATAATRQAGIGGHHFVVRHSQIFPVKKDRSKKAVKSIKAALDDLLKRKPLGETSFPLTFFDKLSIHEKRVKGSSNFTNFELKMRMLRDGGELFRRAYKGDSGAVSELAVLARNLANELNLFAKLQPALIRDIAKSYDEWPVVLSFIDKKKDAGSWQSFFKETLKLGEDSFCCTNRRQKIDLSNTWTRYVWFALKAMRINKVLVPSLLNKCKSKPCIQPSVRIGRTVLRTRFYELQRETVKISEWARLCCHLPDRLTNDDAVIRQFMELLKLAVLEYWLHNPDEYEKAKSKVKWSAKYKLDSDYRSLCFTQMGQQLRIMAGK
jgi:hypothetical protein